MRGQVIGGMRPDLFPCSPLSAAGIYFHACSFNHADISPFGFNDLRAVYDQSIA